MNLLILDLETTGLDAELNGILTICATLYDPTRQVKTSFLANCHAEDSEINLGALKVNKFSIKDVKSFADEKSAILNFCDWLLSLKVEGELVLGGHNPHFDLNFLKNKLKKYNVSGFDQAVSHRVIDTASIGRFLMLSGLLPSGKVSLKDLALTLNVDYDGQKHHSAEYDVDLTARVLFRMIDMLKDIPNGKNQ